VDVSAGTLRPRCGRAEPPLKAEILDGTFGQGHAAYAQLGPQVYRHPAEFPAVLTGTAHGRPDLVSPLRRIVRTAQEGWGCLRAGAEQTESYLQA